MQTSLLIPMQLMIFISPQMRLFQPDLLPDLSTAEMFIGYANLTN